jgi:hypothetical protein
MLDGITEAHLDFAFKEVERACSSEPEYVFIGVGFLAEMILEGRELIAFRHHMHNADALRRVGLGRIN